MIDLYVATFLLVLVSLALGWGTADLLQGASTRTRSLVVVCAVSLLVSYVLWWHESLWWSRLLPVSSLPVLSNMLPLFLGVIGGCVWQHLQRHRARRWSSIGAIACFGGIALVFPLVGHPPACDNEWIENICLQTRATTCAPAAAATLLAAHGIIADEGEMANLCLTRTRGTTWMGAYRGLKLKCADTGLDVHVRNMTVAELRQHSKPVWLRVELKPGANIPAVYTEEWGWEPGLTHAVICFGFVGEDRLLIGDPAVGRELWSLDDLNYLWHGQAIYLASNFDPARG